MNHKSDPAAAHKAAIRLAAMVDAGLIAGAEAEAALAAAAAATPGANVPGLRARLIHTLHDAAGNGPKSLFAPPPLILPPRPFAAVAATLPLEENIPPRAWLYGNFLVRGYVSVLAAPGGVGKSAYALAIALAVVTGRPLLGERVHHAHPAWVLNLEDPMDELNRRVAALMRAHDLPRDAIAGRLHLHSGRTRRLVMAELDRPSGTIQHPDRDQVIAAIRHGGIGLLVVDPFVKSHALDENDNRHMDVAATVWAEIAEATGAAILLVHHVRKGTGKDGVVDIDAARGAKALTDAARAAALLSPMNEDEAHALGVPAAERWRLIRRDDAKANLAPRAARAQWLRLETVTLRNPTEDYPEGDHVGAITAWRPRNIFADISVQDCNIALDLIAAGPAPGARYAASSAPRFASRWAGQVLQLCLDVPASTAAAIINAWLTTGLLVDSEYHDPVARKPRRGVTVTNAKRPSANIAVPEA